MVVALYKEDLERLQRETKSSTCRTLSAYCRKLLLGKAVTVFYRNQSFDAFIEEVVALRKELEVLRQTLPFTMDAEVRIIAFQEGIKKCIHKIYDHVCQDKR